MKDENAFIVGIICIAVGLVAGALLGAGGEHRRMERNAVKAGAAEWVANKDGEPEFKWRVVP